MKKTFQTRFVDKKYVHVLRVLKRKRYVVFLRKHTCPFDYTRLVIITRFKI